MVMPDDFVHRVASDDMFGGHMRLILDERDRILVVLALQRKIRRHHFIRNVSPVIEPHVVAAAQVGHAPDHLKAQAVDQDERAQRRTSREEHLGELVSQHDHVAALRAIQIVEPAPFLQRQVTDLVQLRLGPKNFPASVGKLAYLVQVSTRNDGASITHLRSVPYVLIILVREQIRPRRGHIPFHRRRPPGEQEHDVFAEFGQFALIARAKTFANPHQQEQRSHSPCDAEHGEERAQFMRPQIAENLSENVCNTPHNKNLENIFGSAPEAWPNE